MMQEFFHQTFNKKELLTEIDRAIIKAAENPKTKRIHIAVEAHHEDMSIWVRRQILEDYKIGSEEVLKVKACEEFGFDPEKIRIEIRDIPIHSITFMMDENSRATIYDSKDCLRDFRKRIQRFSLEKALKKPSTVKYRSVAAKGEEILDLIKLKQKEWFTDGNILIKGKPPKNKVMLNGKANYDINDLGIEYEKTCPAKLQYYYFPGFDNRVVSRNPIIRLEDYNNCDNAVLFKSGDKYASYIQAKFRVVANRFPNAEYRMSNNGMLVAYQGCLGKELVAAVMAIVSAHPTTETVPGITLEPTMRKEALEAGFLK